MIGPLTWNRLQVTDVGGAGAAMRLLEGVTFHVAAARETYFDLVASDAVRVRNMVVISEPARRIKQNVTVQDDLGKIDCPTPIVHGTEDFIVPAAPELARQLIPDSQLTLIPDRGRYPSTEQPEAGSRALLSFIDSTRVGD